MIIDSHTHIFPSEIRLDRERFLFPEETAFAAIYRDPGARLIGAEHLVAMMDAEGLDRAVTFGFPWAREDTARRHNDYVREAQERYPDRIIGLACFDPGQPWAEKEAIRALEAGLKGLGELAVYQAGFDAETIAAFSRLAALCRDRDVPMVVHVNEPIGHHYPGKAPLSLEMIYALVKATAGVRLILAHWGGGLFFYHLLKKEVPQALDLVYYDTAASPFLYHPDIYETAARIVGPEKILFGSDYPLLRPGRYFKELAGTGLTVDQHQLICGGNAAKIFWS